MKRSELKKLADLSIELNLKYMVTHNTTFDCGEDIGYVFEHKGKKFDDYWKAFRYIEREYVSEFSKIRSEE